MTQHTRLTRRIYDLWLAQDLALLGQRRERRMRLLACLVMVVVAVLWAPIFAINGQWLGVLMDIITFACAYAVLYLTLHNEDLRANLLLFALVIVMVVGNAFLLDPGSLEAPRVMHVFLLPISIAALMAFRDEPVWLRYGVALLCIVAYTCLASTYWSPTRAYALPDHIRIQGSWIMTLAGMGMFFGLIHILQTDSVERSEMEKALKEAISEEQFVLHFQPQLDAAGRVFGAEALIRWHHPKRGMVPPSEFISLAERTGLIVPLGRWILRTACAQLQAWRNTEWGKDLSLSVNISLKQISQPRFVSEVLGLIDEFKIAPRCLELEITETVIIHDMNELERKMRRLVESGVTFSLDDFGTGYSSLSHLKRLPLSKIKIDRSFVKDLFKDGSCEAIVCSLIALSNSLAMQVVAEGVETEDQRKFLEVAGCKQYQGYFFSKPVPAADFAAYAQARRV